MHAWLSPCLYAYAYVRYVCPPYAYTHVPMKILWKTFGYGRQDLNIVHEAGAINKVFAPPFRVENGRRGYIKHSMQARKACAQWGTQPKSSQIILHRMKLRHTKFEQKEVNSGG